MAGLSLTKSAWRRFDRGLAIANLTVMVRGRAQPIRRHSPFRHTRVVVHPDASIWELA